ncbi:histidine phosphatase superfamily [Tirmania nivea]|nr:histidine phosphatase superfamily [Tirmania nivea]
MTYDIELHDWNDFLFRSFQAAPVHKVVAKARACPSCRRQTFADGEDSTSTDGAMTRGTPVYREEPAHDTLPGESTTKDSHRGSHSQITTILLIRHAETVDNVRHNYAGTTNSPLTNHGILQAEALATSLVRGQAHRITHIAASTLERAHQTATAIHRAARDAPGYLEEFDLRVTRCPELVERHFGSLEGKSYLEAPPQLKRRKVDPKSFYQKGAAHSTSKIRSSSSSSGSSETHYEAIGSESHESLSNRANVFIDSYILPLIDDSRDPINSSYHTKTVAIISHGILLATLFRELVARFHIITVSSEAFEAGFIVGKTPRWDNTGYTHIRLHSPAPPDPLAPETLVLKIPPQMSYKLDCELVVKEINVTRHLKGLKRTAGGIGSARADPKQRSIKDFLKSKAGQKKPVAGVKQRDGDIWGLLPPQPQPQPQPFLEPLASPSSSIPDSPFRTE